MLTLADQLFTFATSLNLPLVILNAVIPRTAKIQTTPTIFMENMMLYNQYLNTFYSTSEHIIYNKQRGFIYYYTPNNKQELRPVSHWSSDGIHCDMPHSQQQYKNRLRHAILDNMHIAKNGTYFIFQITTHSLNFNTSLSRGGRVHEKLNVKGKRLKKAF